MITLALIGAGRWGVNFLKTVEKINGCQIKYIATKTKNSLLKFPNKYIKTTNYKDFLKYDDIDGIIIATPGATHYRIIKKLLSSKLPILVEKPLTINYKNALDIKKSLKSNGFNIMTGHTYLYNPAYLKIKKLIPKIGRIKYISFKLYNFGAFINDMSALWQLAPHGVSLCIDILNQLPQEVSAWEINTLRPNANLCDNFSMRLKFKDGITCFIECGWLYPFKRRELIIYGTKSTIVFDDLNEKKITLYEGLGPDVINGQITQQKAKISYPAYKQVTALELEIREFTNFIKNHNHPKTELDQAIDVIKVIDAAEVSLNSNGKPVRLRNN